MARLSGHLVAWPMQSPGAKGSRVGGEGALYSDLQAAVKCYPGGGAG